MRILCIFLPTYSERTLTVHQVRLEGLLTFHLFLTPPGTGLLPREVLGLDWGLARGLARGLVRGLTWGLICGLKSPSAIFLADSFALIP